MRLSNINSVKRYLEDEDKNWKTKLDKKYIKNAPNIFACKAHKPSRFWQGVMRASKAFGSKVFLNCGN